MGRDFPLGNLKQVVADPFCFFQIDSPTNHAIKNGGLVSVAPRQNLDGKRLTIHHKLRLGVEIEHCQGSSLIVHRREEIAIAAVRFRSKVPVSLVIGDDQARSYCS